MMLKGAEVQRGSRDAAAESVLLPSLRANNLLAVQYLSLSQAELDRYAPLGSVARLECLACLFTLRLLATALDRAYARPWRRVCQYHCYASSRLQRL
jgi:hypothetical protein